MSYSHGELVQLAEEGRRKPMTNSEAIAVLMEHKRYVHENSVPDQALDMGIKALKNERMKGRWMPCAKNGLILTELMREEGVAKWYGYKCSKCNYIHKGNALIEYSYCPNCGADMRKEKTDDRASH